MANAMLEKVKAWDPAAPRLSLHRNTVRNRIDRVAQLTGRRLDDGDDRPELWLALGPSSTSAVRFGAAAPRSKTNVTCR